MLDFLQMQQASEVDRKMSLLRLVQNAEPEQSMADFTRDGPPYVSPAKILGCKQPGWRPQRWRACCISLTCVAYLCLIGWSRTAPLLHCADD